MDSTHANDANMAWRSGTAGAGAARRIPAVVALVLALGMALLPAGSARSADRTWVVDADTVLPAAARVISALPFIDSLVVASPTAITGAVPLDTPLAPQALMTAEVVPGVQVDTGVATVRAPEAWTSGVTGDETVVALIDTGVAPVPALQGAIAGEIDFTGTGGGDGYGHGTFLASVIAGRSDLARGVAPGTGVLSLKVGADDGGSTLGAVLAALQWLHGPGSSSGIRIASMALSVDAGTPAAEFLDRAVDRLAQRDVLVITATGNDGADMVASPSTATRTLSVGAVDDIETVDPSDDVVPTFSATGMDTAGVAQPDVLAPGVDIVGSLPVPSVLADGATEDAGLFSGSGTSMATAVAAGVAALVSDAHPGLGGAALAQALRATDHLDAVGAIEAADTLPVAPGNSGNASGNGNGNGQGNGSGNGQGNGAVDDDAQPQSIRWGSIRWGAAEWNGAGWGAEGWEAASWGSIRWGGDHWSYDGAQPQSIRWGSIRWGSIRWAGIS